MEHDKTKLQLGEISGIEQLSDKPISCGCGKQLSVYAMNGRKGGLAGRGQSKSRLLSTDKAKAMAQARWNKRKEMK